MDDISIHSEEEEVEHLIDLILLEVQQGQGLGLI
jgi:hypothetical protein